MGYVLDLLAISLFQIHVIVDDSGSMCEPQARAELSQFLYIVADFAAVLCHEGIKSLSFAVAEDKGGHNLFHPEAAVQLAQDSGAFVSGENPDMAPVVRKFLKEKFFEVVKQKRMLKDKFDATLLSKPILLYLLTDGRKMDGDVMKEQLEKVVKYNEKSGTRAFHLQIGQIGILHPESDKGDKKVSKILSKLDTHKRFGILVDVSSSFQVEAQELEKRRRLLSPALWTAKFLLGSIDPRYDRMDEIKESYKNYSPPPPKPETKARDGLGLGALAGVASIMGSIFLGSNSFTEVGGTSVPESSNDIEVSASALS